MLNHGISTGGLFLIVGMIYERRHTEDDSRLRRPFEGDAHIRHLFHDNHPSSVALPGTNGFVGEFLILMGVSRITLVYGTRDHRRHIGSGLHALMFQRVMFGVVTKEGTGT